VGREERGKREGDVNLFFFVLGGVGGGRGGGFLFFFCLFGKKGLLVKFVFFWKGKEMPSGNPARRQGKGERGGEVVLPTLFF